MSYHILSWRYTNSRGKFGPGGLYLGAGRKRAVVTKPNEMAGHADVCWSSMRFQFPPMKRGHDLAGGAMMRVQ